MSPRRPKPARSVEPVRRRRTRREETAPKPEVPPDHLIYAPAYHLARLHRGSIGICWSIALACILVWLVMLPSLGSHRPLADFAVVLGFLFVLVPWSVLTMKNIYRFTDRWPEPSRRGCSAAALRVPLIALPIVVLIFGVLLVAIRLSRPPAVPFPPPGLYRTGAVSLGWVGLAVLVALGAGLIVLWINAGLLVRRASTPRPAHAGIRLALGIGTGVVGVLVLVACDLVVRRSFDIFDPLVSVVLLVGGLLAVLFGATFGALHARLCVIIGAIERAEDELRRDDRNRLGILTGDPSMNEESAAARRGPDPALDEIGPIGGHPDPPGT